MIRGRAGTTWMWIVLGSMLCGTAWAEDLRFRQLPAYYQVDFDDLFGDPERPDPLDGFKKTRKHVSDLSLRLASTKLGKHEFTRELIGSAVDSFYQTLVPDRFGEIHMRRPMSILDKTVNGLLGREKERVTKWVDELIPDLPFIGDPLKEIVASQKLQFSGGVPQHSMAAQKSLRMDHQMGEYGFSAGTVLEWKGTDVAQVPAFGFRYGDGSESYALEVTGKWARLNIDTKHVAGNVEWSPKGLKFAVNLTF